MYHEWIIPHRVVTFAFESWQLLVEIGCDSASQCGNHNLHCEANLDPGLSTHIASLGFQIKHLKLLGSILMTHVQ